MAEGQPRLPLAPAFGVTLEGITRNRVFIFALQWFGVPLAALIGLATALYYVISPETLRPLFDDSYISLNFARNLAEHGKLSFDGEEWTTGATSPLHVAVMAVMLKLGAEPFFTSAAVGVASHVLLAVGVYLLAFAVFRSRLAGVLGALAISFTSYAALDAGNGLETSLFMALVAFAAAACLWSDGARARLACGILIALAVLTRPEGAFLIPAVLLYRWLDRPAGESLVRYARDAARFAGPGLAAGVLILIFSLAVSGSFGGTGGAKVSFFQEDEWLLQDKLSVAADQVGIFLGPLLPLIALAAFVAGRRAFLLFALFWVPVLVIYAVVFPGGLGHYFYRYQHPVLPFIAAFAGGGAAFLIATALQRDWVVKALVAFALVVVAVPMYYQYDRWRDIYTAGAAETHADLEAMALDLNTIVEPDETLATHDIGALQYFADYHVLDLVGLANEEVIQYHDQRRLSEYIESAQPEYLLIFPDWDVFFLHLDTEDNPEKYELVKTYEGGNIRQQSYQLFRVNY